MIYIQDYLLPEEHPIISNELEQFASNLNCPNDLITFPSKQQYQVNEVSKKEIGKWVDLLIEIPDPEVCCLGEIENSLDKLGDPFNKVAERILSDESY